MHSKYKQFFDVVSDNPNIACHIDDSEFKTGLLNEFYEGGGEDSSIWSIIKLLLQDNKDIVQDYFKNKNNLKSAVSQFNADKEFINSSFDRDNDLYSQEKIKEAIIILKGSHLFSIFFSDWRKANNLFKDLHLKTTKLSGKEAGKLLKKYYDFIKNTPKQQKKIKDLTNSLNNTKNNILERNAEFNFDLFNDFHKEKCNEILESINSFNDDFNNSWLKNPSSIFIMQAINESDSYSEQAKIS